MDMKTKIINNRNAADYGVCAVSQSDVPVRFR